MQFEQTRSRDRDGAGGAHSPPSDGPALFPDVYIIAVAGSSCAGKTELAKALCHELQCPVLPLDCYYRDLSALDAQERAKINFDAPSALDHATLLEQIVLLSRGRTIELPIYDFKTHTREQRTETFAAGRFLIVEGLFALYWEGVRKLAPTKVFIDAPDSVCLARRVTRDTRERGRTPESVIAQFTETVQPMAEQYVRPTSTFADLVLSGEQPLEISLAAVTDHVHRTLNQRSALLRAGIPAAVGVPPY